MQGEPSAEEQVAFPVSALEQVAPGAVEACEPQAVVGFVRQDDSVERRERPVGSVQELVPQDAPVEVEASERQAAVELVPQDDSEARRELPVGSV